MKTRKITFCVKPTFFEIVKNDRFPNQKHDFWNFHACSGQKSGGRGKQPRRQIYNNFHREAFKPSLTIMNGLADLGILTPLLHPSLHMQPTRFVVWNAHNKDYTQFSGSLMCPEAFEIYGT